jgi:hypothetical protein
VVHVRRFFVFHFCPVRHDDDCTACTDAHLFPFATNVSSYIYFAHVCVYIYIYIYIYTAALFYILGIYTYALPSRTSRSTHTRVYLFFLFDLINLPYIKKNNLNHTFENGTYLKWFMYIVARVRRTRDDDLRELRWSMTTSSGGALLEHMTLLKKTIGYLVWSVKIY